MKEDNESIISVKIDGSKKTTQSGEYGSFYCEICEKNSSIYDRYIANLLRDEKIKINRNSIKLSNGTIELWDGLDGNLLIKFAYAVLIRTYLKAKSSNEELLFNETHFEKLVELYRSELIDDSTYPVVILKNKSEKGYEDVMFYPYSVRRGTHRLISWTIVGYEFNVWISSHGKPDYILFTRVKLNGEAVIVHSPKSIDDLAFKLIQDHVKSIPTYKIRIKDKITP